MVPYNQRLQSYVSKSIDKLFRTIQFRQGVRRVIGTASLEDLSNVSGATPTDGEVLEWSQTQGLWIPGDGGGEGTIPNLQSVMGEGSTGTISTPFMVTSDDGTDISEFTVDANTGFELKHVDKLQADHSQSITIFDNQINLDTSDTAGGVNFSFLHLNHGSDVEMKYEGDNGAGAGLGNSSIKLERDTAIFQLANALGSASLILNPSILKVTGRFEIDDDTNSIGAAYNDDYSSGGISTYGNRWIPDAGWVNTQIATIPSLTVGSDNQIPYSNAGGTDFDYTSDLLFNGTELSLGQGAFSTGSVLNVNNSAASRGTVIRSYDGTGTSSYGVQITNNGAANSGSKTGLLANVTNSGTTITGATGAIFKARDSVTAFANGSPTYVGGHFVASMSTHNAYGLYVDARQSNSGENVGLYVETANAGAGGSAALQLVDGTQGANKFLKSDANGKASWADVPAGATSIGELSDAITDAADNIGLGSGSLASIGATAITNTALGIDAGTSSTTGDRNVFVGYHAAQNFTTANDCVAIGNNAMGTGTGQSTNIAIGSSALLSVTGVGNIAIGNSAGSSITAGGRNIFIGRNANGLNTNSYQIAIGDLSTTQASSLALGRSGQILLHGEFATAGRTKLGVNLGNTYSAPTANLHVKGHASDTTTFLVQNGAGSSILQANQNGNIGIGTTAPQEKLHISTGNDLNSGDISFLIGGTAGTNARTGRIIKNTSSSYEMTIRASDFATGSNLLLNDTGGNVGIGTTSPAEALDISGNVKVDGQAYSATHTLTAAASVAPDFDNSNVQTVTLDQATTLANPTNLKDGATYIVIVKQPAGANHTLAFGTAYKFEGGTDPTITAANGATDVLTFVSDGTNLYGAAALNFS